MNPAGITRWRRGAVTTLALVSLVVVVGNTVGGCGVAGSDRILVAAASSLRAVLPALVGDEVDVSAAGSQQVIAQVAAGAPVDVAIVVGDAARASLVGTGRVIGEMDAVAVNRPALIVAPGNPRRVASLADLVRPDLQVALAGPEVPVGALARRVLEAAGIEIEPRIATANAAAVVTAVALGEADVAIGWRSDAVAGRGQVEIVAIDTPEFERIYTALIVGHRAGAETVLRRLRDRSSAAVWEAFGFEAVAP